MDNMLYILAVLVIILLLAVLVMRRRQSRNLTFLGDSRKIKNDKSYKGFSSLEIKPLNNQSDESIATKFDNVTIAERFMDQQRYDKAIETLKRGLTEKPHDGSLLLKLLNVYVVANQYQDFDRVYHILQAHGDPETIEQADQLKELVGDRYTSSLESSSNEMSLDSSSLVDSSYEHSAADSFLTDDLSLDFDGAQTFGSSQSADAKIDHHDNSNDSFNLTLDDLEAAETSNPMSEDLNIAEDNDLLNININEADLSISSNNAASIDDDFTLDLEDYAAVLRSDALGEDQPIIEHNIDEQDTDELSIDEFSFGLEDGNDNVEDTTSPVLDNEQIFNFAIADKPASDKPTTDGLAIDTFSSTAAFEVLSPAINDKKPADNELFDDDMMFDDLVFDDNNGLDVAAVTDSSSPVNTQKIILTNNLAPVTLDTILTSDFDYVKTLNSYQVTLELADHYLQLGEYDSAKRLLAEVVTQGNSEQQQKAKMLLARTA